MIVDDGAAVQPGHKQISCLGATCNGLGMLAQASRSRFGVRPGEEPDHRR